jgi:hypothetical protein
MGSVLEVPSARFRHPAIEKNAIEKVWWLPAAGSLLPKLDTTAKVLAP